MLWFNMHYQLIWPSKCLLYDFNDMKNVQLVHIDGYNVLLPNVGFIKKVITWCVLNVEILDYCIDTGTKWVKVICSQ